MLACGAKGYVFKIIPRSRTHDIPKDNPLFNLEKAIKTVILGNYYIDEHILLDSDNKGYIFNPAVLVAKRQAEIANLSRVGFTERERKMALLYASVNAKQTEIAKLLSVHNKTLNKQIQAASKKLKVSNRHAFSLRSVGIGLIKIARGIF